MSPSVEIISVVDYPLQIEEYFSKKEIIVKTLPKDLNIIEEECPNFRITTASQYMDFLNSEIEFWSTNDPNNKLSVFVNVASIKNAKTSFQNSINGYKSGNNAQNALQNLNSSIAVLSNGWLYSKTHLASFLLKYINKEAPFFSGFKKILAAQRTSETNWSAAGLDGVNTAFLYLGLTDNVKSVSEECITEFNNNIRLANDNYAKLNQQYNEAFHQQDLRLKETQRILDEFFKEKELRATELEKLYGEKLRLSAPAQYWQETKASYSKKGKWWLGASIATAILTVATLLCVLIFLPDLFSAESHIFDIIKNSAIVTVIASVLIYVMRLFVKLAMSSFHLSRDANERDKLVNFYLSLINEKAVTEKERAIIINALFSRSDTGLLTGESAPVMSADVSSLIDKLSDK